MISYKLLTPGPLTTTETVKQEMMTDHCTWDDDYKQITQKMPVTRGLNLPFTGSITIRFPGQKG